MRRSNGWTNCYDGGSDAWIQHYATDGVWCTDLFLHLLLLLLEHGMGQVPQWQKNLTTDVTAHLSDGARHTGYSEKFRPYRVLLVDNNWGKAKADILPDAVVVCNIDPMVHWCSVRPCDANPTSNLLISRVGGGGETGGGGGGSPRRTGPTLGGPSFTLRIPPRQ